MKGGTYIHAFINHTSWYIEYMIVHTVLTQALVCVDLLPHINDCRLHSSDIPPSTEMDELVAGTLIYVLWDLFIACVWCIYIRICMIHGIGINSHTT